MTKENKKLKHTLACVGDILQQIEQYNERIRFLQSYDEPELDQSILNAKSIRAQFLEQLDKLLETYNLEVKLRAKVA